MALGTQSGTLRDGPTLAQIRLLERHRRGLARLAHVLAAKTGRAPAEIMFVLAHQESNVGMLAREQLGEGALPGSDAVVVPGLAQELPSWIARLALAGPLHDCTSGPAGIGVIVIDEHDEMALCRIPCLTTAASADPGNRSVIPLA